MYRPLAHDTGADAEHFLIRALRQLTPLARAGRVAGLSRGVRQLCVAGIQDQQPGLDITAFRHQYGLRCLGENWLEPLATSRNTWTVGDPIVFALKVAAIFEALRIPYFIGGSVASSIFGEPRSTMDLDVVLDLQREQVKDLVQSLQQDFYISEDAIITAIESQTEFASFNAIELETLEKLDAFILPDNPFSLSAMSRRRAVAVADAPGQTLWVYSPEDIILQKLQWYRLGGQVSTQQWRDILGVIKIQAEALDWTHLRSWAQALNLSNLLELAEQESRENQQ